MTASPIRILLIEDNIGDARLIQEGLTDIEATKPNSVKFRLLRADRLSQGLKYLKDEDIDVVLLDLKLPDSIGIDTFTSVRFHAPKVPIIILTGFDDETLAIRAVREGAQDYLVKGKIDNGLLVRSICYAIERHRLLSRLEQQSQRYCMLFSSGNDAVFVHELTDEGMPSNFIEVNDIACQRLGYTREDLWQLSPSNIYALEKQSAFPAIMKKLLAEKHVLFETIEVTKDGRRIPVEINAHLFELSGKPTILSTARDITERKQIEKKIKAYTENLEKLVGERTKALKESEAKLKAILTGIGDLITIQNRDLDIIWVNQPVEDLWGDVIGKKCYEVYKGLTVPCPDCYVEAVFTEGKTVVSERVDIPPNRKHLHFLITSSPIRDAEGSIVAVVEVEKDITERKKLELQLKEYAENLEILVEQRTKALKESEEKLKAILTGIGDLITIQNKTLDIIWVNQPIGDLWGEVIGKKCYEEYKGLAVPCPECTVEKVFSEGKTVVTDRPGILPDGSQIEMLTTSSPVRDGEGNIVAVVEVIKDITERKELEQQLKGYAENLEASEKRYRGLYESSIDGIAYANIDGKIIDCNHAFAGMLGYSKDELYNLTFWNLTHPRWHDLTEKIHAEQVFTRGYSDEYEKEYVRKDGTAFPISIRTWLIKDKEGTPTGTWAIIRDITERKKLELQLKKYTENLEKMIDERTLDLKESEKRYRGLFESSIDGIAFTNVEGKIVDCNQTFSDMLCYSKEELYNLTLWDITPSKWINESRKIFSEQVFAKGYSEVYEKEYIRKDGTILPISARAWVIKDKDGNPTGSWGIVRDITERYRVMEMKEKFISTATHELRTPLISIKGYIDFIFSEGLEATADLIAPSLEVVRRNTERLVRLTDDLLDIQRIESGRISLEFNSLNLIEIINHCIEEIQPFLDEKSLSLHLRAEKNPLMIQGDPIRLSQIIMNLLNNATKFTPEGGDITLSVEEKEDYIHVRVSDTGIGLRKEDLEKVFQPFADIKKPTYIKGTGLGLSVTKGLVEAHGGKTWAHSDGEGKGATFCFTLPKQKAKEESNFA